MTSTRIELSFNRIARLQDAGDLAELLFPGNRNQQHCFLVIWFSLKWADRGMVPNLSAVATEQGITRRSFERVRAKMRRLGLIDHVSRFDKSYGYREGWTLSRRFGRSLRVLAERVEDLGANRNGSHAKDNMLIAFAQARCRTQESTRTLGRHPKAGNARWNRKR